MTAQPNANALIPTTVATIRLSSLLVRTMQTVLTSLTAPPKSVPGSANPVISRREAPASWRIPAGHIINVTARISIVPEDLSAGFFKMQRLLS